MRPDSFRANVRQVNTLQNEVIKLARDILNSQFLLKFYTARMM